MKVVSATPQLGRISKGTLHPLQGIDSSGISTNGRGWVRKVLIFDRNHTGHNRSLHC